MQSLGLNNRSKYVIGHWRIWAVMKSLPLTNGWGGFEILQNPEHKRRGKECWSLLYELRLYVLLDRLTFWNRASAATAGPTLASKFNYPGRFCTNPFTVSHLALTHWGIISSIPKYPGSLNNNASGTDEGAHGRGIAIPCFPPNIRILP